MTLKRTRKQSGGVYPKTLADGRIAWVFRYREAQPNGKPRHRSVLLGTSDDYPDRVAAEHAAEAIRHQQSKTKPVQPVVTMAVLIERYLREGLPDRYSTRCSYESCLKRHIKPKWGALAVSELAIDPYQVELWLAKLHAAPKTKAHLKAIMHRMFEYAMKWRVLPIGRNPMSLVEVKGASRRRRRPLVLSVEQCFLVLYRLPDPYRTMVLVAMALGLRISEILALQWRDFDFERGTVLVQRSVVHGRVDAVKTEYSEDELPLEPAVAAVLLRWKERSVTSKEGWVFASPWTLGPYHASPIQQDYLRPAGKEAGLGEHIGWHTFRHSYRSWLDAAGTPAGVQQKLLRHASITTTMNVYGNAQLEEKRRANSKVVEMLRPALEPRKTNRLLRGSR